MRFVFLISIATLIVIAGIAIGHLTNDTALKWTILIVGNGVWGWHSDRVFGYLFHRRQP